MLRDRYTSLTRKNKQNAFIINERGEVRKAAITTRGISCASPIDFNSKAKRALYGNINAQKDKNK